MGLTDAALRDALIPGQSPPLQKAPSGRGL